MPFADSLVMWVWIGYQWSFVDVKQFHLALEENNYLPLG
jgi:hypothetical protein